MAGADGTFRDNVALSKHNRAAISSVTEKAKVSAPRDLERLSEMLISTPYSAENLVERLFDRSRVSICFHPYRICQNGKTVIEGLIQDGEYKSQFVTRISNGGVTAYPGGDRDVWEERMFSSAYKAAGALDEERPKYGALNALNFIDGAAPRFGSCSLVLNREIGNRCTFTFGDSATLPDTFGTRASFFSIIRAILEEAAGSGKLLGVVECKPQEALKLLYDGPNVRLPVNGRDMCTTIEAQIHGKIDLGNDVDAVCVDEAFRHTPIERHFLLLCEKYGIDLKWIPLRRVSIAEIDEEFRGAVMKDIARRAAEEAGAIGGFIDAAIIGCAARSVAARPEKWAQFGSPPELLQRIKQLWHIVANFGC